MLTKLLILDPQNNKAEAPDSLFTSSTMVFMPFYLKIHLSLIAPLTHVPLTLQPLYLEELLPQGEGPGEQRQRAPAAGTGGFRAPQWPWGRAVTSLVPGKGLG